MTERGALQARAQREEHRGGVKIERFRAREKVLWRRRGAKRGAREQIEIFMPARD